MAEILDDDIAGMLPVRFVIPRDGKPILLPRALIARPAVSFDLNEAAYIRLMRDGVIRDIVYHEPVDDGIRKRADAVFNGWLLHLEPRLIRKLQRAIDIFNAVCIAQRKPRKQRRPAVGLAQRARGYRRFCR